MMKVAMLIVMGLLDVAFAVLNNHFGNYKLALLMACGATFLFTIALALALMERSR